MCGNNYHTSVMLSLCLEWRFEDADARYSEGCSISNKQPDGKDILKVLKGD